MSSRLKPGMLVRFAGSSHELLLVVSLNVEVDYDGMVVDGQTYARITKALVLSPALNLRWARTIDLLDVR